MKNRKSGETSSSNKSQSPSITLAAAGCPPPTRTLNNNTCPNTANIQFFPCQDPAIDSLGIPAGVIAYTNLLRANMGLPPLTTDPGLMAGAQWKADDMASFDYIRENHTDSAGRTPQETAEFLRQTDPRIKTNCIQENAAASSFMPTPHEAFTQWFCSLAGHFQAMTNPQNDSVGVGFAQGPTLNTKWPNKWVMWLANSKNQFPLSCAPLQGPVTGCQPGWKLENGNWVYYYRDSSGNCVKQTSGWVFDDESNDMKQALRIFTFGTTHNWFWIDPNTQAWSGWVWNDIDKRWWQYRTDNNWYQYQCDPNGQNCQVVQQSSSGPFR